MEGGKNLRYIYLMNTLTKVLLSFDLVTQRFIRPTIVARRSLRDETKARKEITSWHTCLYFSHKYEMIHFRVVAIILSSFISVFVFLSPSWSNYRKLPGARICELKGKGADTCRKGLVKTGVFLE